MSDPEGSDPEGEEDQDTQLVYICKRCPGKQFRTVSLKDAHREWHREQRLSKTKPGPASKTRSPRARAHSPVASEAGTLFSVRDQPTSKKTPTATKSSKKPTDTSTSSKARRARALAIAKKHSKTATDDTNGG